MKQAAPVTKIVYMIYLSSYNMNVNQSHHANNTDFLSTDEIADMSLDDLVGFILKKGKNHFFEPAKTAKLLQKAARYSYRLDKCLYEPLTITLSSSFNELNLLKIV